VLLPQRILLDREFSCKVTSEAATVATKRILVLDPLVLVNRAMPPTPRTVVIVVGGGRRRRPSSSASSFSVGIVTIITRFELEVHEKLFRFTITEWSISLKSFVPGEREHDNTNMSQQQHTCCREHNGSTVSHFSTLVGV
jgi:hypothetical protein